MNCSKCGFTLETGQKFCPNCGCRVVPLSEESIGTHNEAHVEDHAEEYNEESSKRRSVKFSLLEKAIVVIFAIAACCIVVFLLCREPSLKRAYDNYCSPHYSELSPDGNCLMIDTNPNDSKSSSLNEPVLRSVAKVNRFLGFPYDVYNEMEHTSSLDGVRRETNENFTVSWTYHPNKGLEVTYERLIDNNSGSSSNSVSNSSTETVTPQSINKSDSPIYPKNTESNYLDYATEMPITAYSTHSSENDLDGNAYYVTGTVTEVVDNDFDPSIERDDGEDRHFIIENENGSVYFVDFIEYINANSNKYSDNQEVVDGLEKQLSDNTDYSFPSVGDTVTVYGFYFGYSDKEDTPVFIYGLNEVIHEIIFEEDTTSSDPITSNVTADNNSISAEALADSLEYGDILYHDLDHGVCLGLSKEELSSFDLIPINNDTILNGGYMLYVSSDPTGIGVAFDDSDMISIIIINSSDPSMRGGISVGSSVEDVHSVYGDDYIMESSEGGEMYLYNSISGEIINSSDLNSADSAIVFVYENDVVQTIAITKT